MYTTRYLCAAVCLAAATVASAAVIPFDPDGPGPGPAFQVGSFDFLPGNAWIQEDLLPGGPDTVIIHYQARLGALLDPSGQVIPTPGLNAPANAPNSYEITAALSVSLRATAVSPGVTVYTPSFLPPRYLSIYHDLSPDANDLAGTGFRDGLRIFGGSTSAGSGVYSIPVPVSGPIDQFGADNYPGVTARLGNGSFRTYGDAMAAAPAFFPTGTLVSFLLDSSLTTPFFHIDPAATFEVGPDGGTNVQPVILSPVDILAQADGALTFNIIPEPTSLSLLVLGALTALGHRRT